MASDVPHKSHMLVRAVVAVAAAAFDDDAFGGVGGVGWAISSYSSDSAVGIAGAFLPGWRTCKFERVT